MKLHSCFDIVERYGGCRHGVMGSLHQRSLTILIDVRRRNDHDSEVDVRLFERPHVRGVRIGKMRFDLAQASLIRKRGNTLLLLRSSSRVTGTESRVPSHASSDSQMSGSQRHVARPMRLVVLPMTQAPHACLPACQHYQHHAPTPSINPKAQTRPCRHQPSASPDS